MKTILSYILTAMISCSFSAVMMALFIAGGRADERNGNK